jgi:hypothetical protein
MTKKFMDFLILAVAAGCLMMVAVVAFSHHGHINKQEPANNFTQIDAGDFAVNSTLKVVEWEGKQFMIAIRSGSVAITQITECP